MRWRVIAAVSAIAAVVSGGCADPQGPPPAGGYNHDQVDYTPPPLVDPTVVSLGEIDLSQEPVAVQQITERLAEAPDGPLAFTATVAPGPDEPEVTVLLIEFRFLGTGGEQTSQTAIGGPDPRVQPAEGQKNLRVEFPAPHQKGMHSFTVKLIRPARSMDAVLIREGTMTVR